MLSGTLAQHPSILGFSELFNLGNRIGFNVKGYDNNSEKLLDLRRKHPVHFLDRYIFSSYREDIRAVGFKLIFPEQLEKEEYQCLSDWLTCNKDLRVILLARRNLLAAHTSLLIAKKTGVYGITDESERPDVRVTVDCRKCLGDLHKIDDYRQKLRRQLGDHDLIEAYYEDIIEDFDGHFRRFHEFLGVDARAVKPVGVKKEVRPLTEVITNYSELRKTLLDTPWGYLVEESSIGHRNV